MTKSQITAYSLYVKAQRTKWMAGQDFKAKYEKLSKKKQEKYAQLASDFNALTATKVPKATAVETPKEKKQRKITGFGVFSKHLRERWTKAWRENNEPMPADTTPKAMRERYAAISPEKRQRCEDRAAELNAQ